MARPADAVAAAPSGDRGIGERVAALPWARLEEELQASGCALIASLLTARECRAMADLYEEDTRFRTRIDMERFGFGRGEYRYFAYPLPEPVRELRGALYRRLTPVANRWHEALGIEARFPAAHDAYLARCRAAGQTKPTPLILSYESGDYNCLHQDLYGDQIFPLQVAILLSEPGRDFSGGEFVLAEQRPRRQSRVEVVPLAKGDAAVLAVHHRPAMGRRGWHRVNLRHGVSRVRSGRRRTLGIIFHDAG